MHTYISAQYLAWRLRVPLQQLKEIARQAGSHYRSMWLHDRKRNKSRELKVPDTKLSKLQRRVLDNVLRDFSLPDSVHGGVRGGSTRTNAERHVGKSLVVNLDIRDFFPNVDHRQVAKMFQREFGCGRDTAWILTRLTTFEGEIPQGAPTSTMIANLLLASPLDEPVERRAAELDIDFTRFVDDITFSGERADELINDAARAASRVSLRMWRNHRKLKITPRSQRQEVAGLTVNSGKPSVSQKRRDKVRVAIHGLSRVRDERERERQLQSIRGRINYVEQFNPGSARRLRRQLGRVLESSSERE